MATANFSRTETISAVTWTGTNLDEVVAFVTAANVSYINGNLSVYGVTVALNSLVVKNQDGTFREVATTAQLTADTFAAV